MKREEGGKMKKEGFVFNVDDYISDIREIQLSKDEKRLLKETGLVGKKFTGKDSRVKTGVDQISGEPGAK